MDAGRDRNEEEPDGRRPGRPPLLTAAQLRVLAAVDDLAEELGHAPSQRLILARVGWSSRGSLWQYLQQLRALGVIEGSGRAMRIVHKPRRQ